MKNPTDRPAASDKDTSHKPHDMLFKAVFKRPHLAAEILRAKAPKKLLAILNLDTLRLSDTSFVDKKLSEDFADIVLACDTDRGDPVEIPFVLEHKSNVPTYPNYQVMSYQFQIWGQQIQGGKGSRPTPVVTVVFFHGKDEWKEKHWKKFLKGYRKEFKRYTPRGGYIFINLSEMSDKQIKQFRSGFLTTSLLLMKHRFEKDFLLDNLQEIFTFVEADNAEEDLDNRIENLKYALSYLHSLLAARWEEARVKLQSLNLTNRVMTAFETAFEVAFVEVKKEAFQEGIEKGIEKGKEEFITRLLLDGTLKLEQIASIGAVSLEFVLQIKKRIDRTAALSSPKKPPLAGSRRRTNIKPASKKGVAKKG